MLMHFTYQISPLKLCNKLLLVLVLFSTLNNILLSSKHLAITLKILLTERRSILGIKLALCWQFCSAWTFVWLRVHIVVIAVSIKVMHYLFQLVIFVWHYLMCCTFMSLSRKNQQVIPGYFISLNTMASISVKYKRTSLQYTDSQL